VLFTDKNEVDMGAIVVTATDLLLMMDNLQWLLPKVAAAPQKYCAQKIINLIEVVSIQKHILYITVFTMSFAHFFLQDTFFTTDFSIERHTCR
jgi:hypothetical protein